MDSPQAGVCLARKWPSMGKITESMLVSVQRRLLAHIRKNWADRVIEFKVRVRAQFVYVDVEFAEAGAKFVDPADLDGQDDDDDEEENLPPLMRLRFLGRASEWQLARYDWSRGRTHYEPSVLMNGQPFGTPEECFDAARTRRSPGAAPDLLVLDEAIDLRPWRSLQGSAGFPESLPRRCNLRESRGEGPATSLEAPTRWSRSRPASECHAGGQRRRPRHSADC